MGRRHIKDHSRAYSGTLPSGEIKKLRAAVDHSLSGRWQPTASISDFWFPFSVSRFLISDIRFLSSIFWFLFSGFCYLFSVFWFLISDSCFLVSDFCFLFSVFWCLFSDICFLIPDFCFLVSDICFLFSYHILHWVKEKTAHLINKICCPYCQAFFRPPDRFIRLLVFRFPPTVICFYKANKSFSPSDMVGCV